MIHIGEDGELIEIGGTLLEMAGDIGTMMAVTGISMAENGFDEEDITEYFATLLRTAIDAVGNEKVAKGIKGACRVVSEFIGSDKHFRIYRKIKGGSSNSSGNSDGNGSVSS